MNFIIWLIAGGVIGWVARIIMKIGGQQGVELNMSAGIVEALIGGWLISPLVGMGTINQDNFSVGALVVSLIGALIFLAIVGVFRRGSTRCRPLLNLTAPWTWGWGLGNFRVLLSVGSSAPTDLRPVYMSSPE